MRDLRFYVTERYAHGGKLGERERVQWLVDKATVQIEIERLLVMRAAAKLDRGEIPCKRR